MVKRTLGRTGLRVSVVSLGTVELGLDYGIASTGERLRPSEEEARELLHRALDLGINLIDTARAYGESEAIIGRALCGRRHEFVLVTKVQSFAREVLKPAERVRKITGSVEESLRQLRSDAVDILLLHSYRDDEIGLEGVAEGLADLKRRGLARFTGISAYGSKAALKLVECGLYEFLQLAWSPLDRRIEEEVLPAAAAHGVGIMGRSVLMRGALTNRWRFLPESLAAVRAAAQRLESLAAEHGMALPELAYRYVLSRDGPITALVGTGRKQELEACASYAAAGPLDGDLLDVIRAVSVADPEILDIRRWET